MVMDTGIEVESVPKSLCSFTYVGQTCETSAVKSTQQNGDGRGGVKAINAKPNPPRRHARNKANVA